MSTLQEIEAAFLRLSDRDRLQLADKILGSLPPPPVSAEPQDGVSLLHVAASARQLSSRALNS